MAPGWGVATRASGPVSRQYGAMLPADRSCYDTAGETTTTRCAVGVLAIFVPHGLSSKEDKIGNGFIDLALGQLHGGRAGAARTRPGRIPSQGSRCLDQRGSDLDDRLDFAGAAFQRRDLPVLGLDEVRQHIQ